MKRIAWEPPARADLRSIGQRQAMHILHGLGDFARTGNGDIKKLVGDTLGRHRLRIGDWRILFRFEKDDTIRI